MFTCQICYEEKEEVYRVTQTSKGCKCNAQICSSCFVTDFYTRVQPVEVEAPSPNLVDENGPVTHILDLHWTSQSELVEYLFYKFLETEFEAAFRQQNVHAANDFIKKRMKQGKPCAFCGVFAIWDIGSEPHVEDGKIRFTPPIITSSKARIR